MKKEKNGAADDFLPGKHLVPSGNIRNLKCISSVIILFAVLNLILFQWNKESFPADIRMLYVCLWMFLFLLGAISFLLMRGSRKHIKRNACLIETYIYGFIFTVLMLSGILTLLEQMVYGQITVFMIHYILCTALLLTVPPVFHKLQVVPLLMLFLGLPVMQPESGRVIMDYIHLAVLCIGMNLINHWNYRVFCKNETCCQEIGRLAGIDELTGLNNRRRLRSFIEETMKNRSAVSSIGIIMFDIDYFKKYNDYYGHAMGDMVLTSIGAVINELSAQHGVFAARYGGEEFIVILRNRTLLEVSALAVNIKKSIADLQIENRSLGYRGIVSVSIGQYWTGKLPSRLEFSDLIKKADAALYHAKRNGRNQISKNSA